MFSKFGKLLSTAKGGNHFILQNQNLCSIRTIITGSNSRRNIENPLKDYNGASVNTYTAPFIADLTTELKIEHDEFMSSFPSIVLSLMKSTGEKNTLIAAKHFEQAIQYNIPDGKKIRGLIAVSAYKQLIGENNLSAKNKKNVHLLGWCIEMLQSVFLMADDMIDCSKIRRNKPCWHRLANVKSVAVNDSMMIENALYVLLKEHFSHLPCYVDLFELLHETTMMTTIGQSMDFLLSREGVSQFTMDKHKCMTDHKTSHFAFYTPLAASMLLAGYNDQRAFKKIQNICNELGHFYQVQNDFLDCFSDPDVLKKPGSDIEEGKCTWMAVLTMESGSHQQKQILKECYGKNVDDCVKQVKQIYDDLAFPDLYSQYELNTYNYIRNLISDVNGDILQNILLNSLNRTFNRT